LHADVRLAWKGLTVTNTLPYCNMAKITAVKSFIVRTAGPCTIKIFTDIIVAVSS
jgi:hypothetical protein